MAGRVQTLRHAARLLRRHPRYFRHLLRRRGLLAARYRWVRRHAGSSKRLPPPLVYKLILNWECNLRCPMCMLWGSTGWVKTDEAAPAQELAWEIVEKIFASDLPRDASFILSGGEPLLHPRYGELLRLLQEQRKFAITCTNGLLLDRFLGEIDGNPYATFLVSLDGPEELTDRLRGRGVHQRLMANLEQVQALGKPPFVGIQFTIMPENVSCMEDFCAEMVAHGVDFILLNPGWFLSAEQGRAYESFVEERFGVRPISHRGYLQQHEYDRQALEEQLRRIQQRSWPIQVASYLRKPEWVGPFLDTPGAILDNALCYKQWLRLDVLPDGRVTPCVQFPDVCVGDLSRESVEEVWQGPANRRFQEVVRSEPLPVCAQCNNIYLYDGRA